MKSKRIIYAILTVAILITEVLIALFVNDNFIRPYLGDILVVVLIYTFIRIFVPESLKLLPLYVFIFAAGIEVLQYFQIVKILGLENNTFFRVVIGSVFDWKDIMCYAVGCICVCLAEYFIKEKAK